MESKQSRSSDPRAHARKIRGMLNDVIEHARQDIDKVDDRQARALFEMTAEVLDGIQRTYQHFEDRSEAAFR